MECFSLSLLSPTFILNPNLPHLSNSQSARSLTIKVRLEKGKNNRTCFYNGNSPFPSEEKQYWSWWTVTTVAPRGPPLLAVTPWYSSHPHLPLTLDLASEILAHMGWKQKLSKCLHIGAGLRRMNAWSSHPSARKRSSGKPCQQREGETGRRSQLPVIAPGSWHVNEACWTFHPLPPSDSKHMRDFRWDQWKNCPAEPLLVHRIMGKWNGCCLDLLCLLFSNR